METITDIEIVLIRDGQVGEEEQLPPAPQPEKLPVIEY